MMNEIGSNASIQNDNVSISLKLVLDEIAAIETNLKRKGIEAFTNSLYQEAVDLTTAGKQLKQFTEKLTTLKDEWNSEINANTKEMTKVEPISFIEKNNKRAKQNLKITLVNGVVIKRTTAAAAFVDAIRVLGVDRVKNLNIEVSGIPLIDTEKDTKYSQHKLGDYFVFTNTSTEYKANLLKKIGSSLEYIMKIEIIP